MELLVILQQMVWQKMCAQIESFHAFEIIFFFIKYY